jgi:hypothetical protein
MYDLQGKHYIVVKDYGDYDEEITAMGFDDGEFVLYFLLVLQPTHQ